MKDKQLKPVKDDGRKNKIYCDEAAAAQTQDARGIPAANIPSFVRAINYYRYSRVL